MRGPGGTMEGQRSITEDFNHNDTKPSTSFLHQYHGNSQREEGKIRRLEQKEKEGYEGQSASPTANRKIYIPPLDLSILHEHGDGTGERANPPPPPLLTLEYNSYRMPSTPRADYHMLLSPTTCCQ